MKGKKTGGRQKGTQNKSTKLTKEVLSTLLSDYKESGLMLEDFKHLSAKDRMTIAEKMMQYVIPKMQSTSVALSSSKSEKNLDDTLTELSKDPDK